MTSAVPASVQTSEQPDQRGDTSINSVKEDEGCYWGLRGVKRPVLQLYTNVALLKMECLTWWLACCPLMWLI